MRIFLALFILTFFIGFGMVSLTKAYEHTKEHHVAWMENKMRIELEAEKEAVVPDLSTTVSDLSPACPPVTATVVLDTTANETVPARSYADSWEGYAND